ncbi:MAG: sigma-70 family RNA polymerase sigma factor [Myxococcota bacterium]
MHPTTNRDLIASALRAERGSLRAFVCARVAEADVDDVLQQVALRAVERASTLRDPERVVQWLYRLHRNAIVDLYRRHEADGRLADALEPVAEAAESKAPLDENCKCSLVQMRTLRESYARILELVEVEGKSLKEAAGELGISVNNATVRLHRARKALRERLLEHCGVEGAAGCNDCHCTYEGCCAA